MLLDVSGLPDEITPENIDAVFVQYTTSDGAQELEVSIVKEEQE